ncbi:MAG TPA: hypothetical protein VEA59_01110 [Patescibacteria group bacterium]|nr:hypothetical protein [Patescibacteria group bacterium]
MIEFKVDTNRAAEIPEEAKPGDILQQGTEGVRTPEQELDASRLVRREVTPQEAQSVSAIQSLEQKAAEKLQASNDSTGDAQGVVNLGETINNHETIEPYDLLNGLIDTDKE